MDTKKIETVLTTVTIDSKVDSGKIDVVVGESAKMDVVKAVNYIQSGKAEIEAGVTEVLNQVDDHVAEKTAEFDLNASNKTGDFNTNAINKTTDFNDNYTAKKDVIDDLVDDASDFADLSKQWAIGEPSEPTGGSSKYWAGQASSSLSGLTSRVSAIEGKIPADASSSNQLADKNYVNTADNGLQSQIDALVVASDVFDIVGTYAELQAYDISTVPVNDIIKVLVDETHSGAATYYRCVETGGVKSWSYIGSEGAYYTKSEADSRFATPSDIGNGTITLTQGGTTKGSFTTNQSGNATIDFDAGGGGIQNTATGTDSLTILGNSTQYEQAINIGQGSYAYGNYATALGGNDPEYGECQADDYGTSIGASAQGGVGSTAVGYAAVDSGSGNTLVGRETFIDEYVTNSVAIGREAQVTGEGTNVTNAVQIGAGVNQTSNTVQVGSYKLLDTSTGLIPIDRVSNLLEAIYPVGSVYIGTQSTCPMSTVMSGTTWTLVSSGKALWTGNGTAGSGTTTNANFANAPANTTIAAGLPNITGNIENSGGGGGFTEGSGTGCFTDTTNYAKMKTHAAGSSSYDTVANKLVFNASNSNSIYGKSTTVQPPAYVVNVWRRTA